MRWPSDNSSKPEDKPDESGSAGDEERIIEIVEEVNVLPYPTQMYKDETLKPSERVVFREGVDGEYGDGFRPLVRNFRPVNAE